MKKYIKFLHSFLNKIRLIDIFIFAILIRLILSFISPISLGVDGIVRYIPDSTKIIVLDFSFWTPPLYSFLLAPINLINNFEIKAFLFKLLNLLLFAGVLWETKNLIQKFIKNEKVQKLLFLFYACLTWGILLSFAIFPDMLLAYLFMLLIKFLLKENNWKKYIFTTLISFLILMTKPMGILILIGIFLFILLSKESLRTKAVLSFCLVFAGFLFLPWPIKNYHQTGNFFETIQEEEEKKALEFIALNKFPEQVEKSVAYFWEYPSYEKIQDISKNPKLDFLANSYFFLNLFTFLFISIIFVLSLKNLLQQKRRNLELKKLFIIALPSLIFSLLYFPFFSKYNYWDTGRYSFPFFSILLVMLGIFISKVDIRYKNIFAILIGLASILSLINAFAITLNYSSNERKIKELLPMVSEYKKVYTNDLLTKEVLYFYGVRNIEFDPNLEIKSSNCEPKNGYNLCKDKETLLISSLNPSRLTR